MMRKLSLGCAALALGATALVPATAEAQSYRGHHGHARYSQYDGYRSGYADRYDRYDRGYDRHDYRYRDNRCDSTGGTLIGAIAGGLLGNAVAGYGDRTLGTVLGAGAGALAGRAIDRSDNPGYCRR